EAASDLQGGSVTPGTTATNRRHCTAKPRRCTLAPACPRSAPPREVAIEASTAPDQPGDRSLLGKAMQRLGALPAGVLAGALFGALVGGVLGRILMRIIFLIDKSNDGAETDFGTVGEITVGGTLTLIVPSTRGDIRNQPPAGPCASLPPEFSSWPPWPRIAFTTMQAHVSPPTAKAVAACTQASARLVPTSPRCWDSERSDMLRPCA